MRKGLRNRMIALAMAFMMIGTDALPIVQYEVKADTIGKETSIEEETSIVQGPVIEDGVVTGYNGDASVEEITLDATVKKIAAGAFTEENCPNLQDVHLEATEKVTIEQGAFSSSTVVWVAENLTSEYDEDDRSGCHYYVVPEGASVDSNGYITKDTILYAYVPSRNASATKNMVVIPESVTEVKPFAFLDAEAVEISIPASLCYIPENGMHGCEKAKLNLTEADIVAIYENELNLSVFDGNDVILSKDQMYDTNQFDKITGMLLSSVFYTDTAVEDENGFIVDVVDGKKRLLKVRGAVGTVNIPEGIEEIYSIFLYGNELVDRVNVPATVDTLYVAAFYGDIKVVNFEGSMPPVYKMLDGDKIEEMPIADAFADVETIYVPEDGYGNYVKEFLKCGDDISQIQIENEEEPVPDEDGFLIKNGVLLGYEGEGGDITIPDEVTLIADNVFYENTSITRVTFPEGLQGIGRSAFLGCTGLTGNLIFPAGMEYIGIRAFKNCGSNFGLIHIPDNISMEYDAFYNVAAEIVMVGNNVKHNGFFDGMEVSDVGLLVLLEKDKLDADYLYDFAYSEVENAAVRIECVEDYNKAIADDTSWPNVYLYYYEGGFIVDDYGRLDHFVGTDASIVIPKTVNDVGYNAFSYTGDRIKEITLLSYPGQEFAYYVNELPNLEKVILKDMSAEHYNATLLDLFYNEYDVNKVEIQGLKPDDQGFSIIEEDGMSALIHVNSNNETIIVPEGVTHISSFAFKDCKKTKKVILPTTIEAIGIAPFMYSAIQEIQFKSTVLPACWGKSEEESPEFLNSGEREVPEPELDFLGTMEENGILYGVSWNKIIVPYVAQHGYKYIFDGYTDKIETDGNIGEIQEFVVDSEGTLRQYTGPGGAITIPSNVVTIPKGVFTGMDHITSVTFQEGLVYIEENAFSECATLGGTLSFPDSLISIGENAFYSTVIEKIVWGDGLKYIGYGAFSNCLQLRKMNAFPNSLAEIGGSAFEYTGKLEIDLKLPDSLTDLSYYAFYGSGIRSVAFGSELTTISGSVFGQCNNLEGKVVIPDQVTSIGGSAFYGCTNLEEVVIPEGVTNIEYSAFENCSSLERIRIPNSLTSIGTAAFRGCSGLKEAVIGDGLKSLAKYTFRNCRSLETIVLGSQFYEFGTYCMDGCTSIQNYIFKGKKGLSFSGGTGVVSGTDSYYSGVPSTFTSSKIAIYAPSASMTSVKNTFNGVVRIRNKFGVYNLLSLAGQNRTIMEGEDGIYFSFENPYEIPLTKWEVIQGGNVVKTVTDGTTSCFVPGGSVEKSYGLRVYASNTDYYEWSDAENPAAVLTGNMGLVETAYGDNVIVGTKGELHIDVWFESVVRANKKIDGTFYYEKGNGEAVTIGNASPIEDSEDRKRQYQLEWNVENIPAGTYKVWFEISDTKETSEPVEFIVQKEDTLSKVEGLEAVSNSDGTITLTWSELENREDIHPEVLGYYVYRTNRDGQEVKAAVISTGTEWTDRDVEGGETYSYRVCAYNAHETMGEMSDSVNAISITDIIAPIIIAETPDKAHMKGSYDFYYRATDNRQVARMRIYVKYPGSKNFVHVRTEKYEDISFYFYTEEEISQEIQVKVEAMDISGNISTQVYTYYIDYTAPEPVKDVTVKAEKSSALTVSFTPSVSDDVKEYQITLDGETKTVESDVTEVEFTGLKYATDYEASVVAVDVADNVSVQETAVGRTLDNVKPAVSINGIEEDTIYHGTVGFCVKTADDYRNSDVFLEYSKDGEEWNSYSSWMTNDFLDVHDVVMVLDSFKDLDKVYVRAYAIDMEGLQSDYVTKCIKIDYQGPTMEEEAFVASYKYPYLTVSFKQSSAQDTVSYEVLRGAAIQKTFVHNAEEAEQIHTIQQYGLTFGSSYSFKVIAKDRFGNSTTLTKSFKIYNYEKPTIGEITVSKSPRNLSVGGEYDTVTAFVSYPDNGGDRSSEITKATYSYVDKNGEEVVLDAKKEVADTGMTVSAVLDLDTLSEVTKITLTVEDTSGNTFKKSQNITLVTESPAQVENFYVNATETYLSLNWAIATEITSVQYNIYKKAGDGEYSLLATIPKRSIQTYTDSEVMEDVEYSYYIVAVNDMGIEGEPSVVMSGSLVRDTTPPKLIVTPATGKVFGKTIMITAKATDNVDVAEIRIYLVEENSEKLMASTQGDTLKYGFTPDEGGTYQIRIEAEDEKGLKTEEIRTFTADRTGPEKITNITIDVTATTAAINWGDVADSDFSYFMLEEYDEVKEQYKEKQLISNARGVALYGLTPDTEYKYQVVAYDIYENRGTASDPILVKTAKDNTDPVITSISPKATYFNDDFTVKFTAEDDAAIAKITAQYSKDGMSWTDLASKEFEGINRKEKYSYTVKAEDYEDGQFYVRAIAYDTSGNSSDMLATAPYTQYGFDRVAPAVPKNVTAQIENGQINISWDDNVENDLDGYNVYRDEAADGEFLKKIATGIKYLNKPDTSTVPGKTYYYKVSAVDKWGNESKKSDIVAMTMMEDTTKPFVHSISPATGSVLSAYSEFINVKISDNYKLSKLVITYQMNDGKWQQLCEVTDINEDEKVISAAIPTSLVHGDTFNVKAVAYDLFGNVSDSTTYSEASYIMDKKAPIIKNLDYIVEELDVTLTWMCYEEDTNGFYVYRRKTGENYKRIGNVGVNETGSYSFKDETITESSVEYEYRIKALDNSGNSTYSDTDAISITAVVPEYPIAILDCTTSMQVDTEYIFDATRSATKTGNLTYSIDFGDGTTKATDPYVIHKYEKTGDYVVRVEVTNDQGYSHVLQKEVVVVDKTILGTVNVKVKNPSGQAISNIPVYFDMANTTDHVLYTNGSGIASFTVQAGSYLVGAYADGYLPDQSQAVVAAGVTRTIELILEQEPIVTGSFQVERMTLSEVKAAGIDMSNPANQNMIEVSIKMSYGDQEVEMSCYSPSGEGGTVISKPKIITTSSGEKRKLTPRPMASVERDKTPNGGSGNRKEGPEAVVVLDVPAEASCLKEFFDVKLHIINNASSEFHLINNEVTLEVPTGMALVKTAQSEHKTVKFPSLAGQEQKTISWVLRGDKEGSYDLSADYSAVLDEFDEEVKATFKTEEPIHVYGMSNLEMVVQVNKQLLYNTVYFNIGLRNLGPIDLSYPKIEIDEEAVSAAALTGVKDKECEVVLLEQRVSNDKGFEQVVGQAPDVLAAGEMYMKEYAIYGAASDTDIGSLQDAIVEILEQTNRVKVIVETVSIDLYDGENADEMVASMLSGDASHAYDWLVTDKNFAYYTAFEHAEGDFSDEIYEFGQLIFAGNADAITQTDEEDIIKGYMAEMMSTVQVQKNVAERVDTSYIDTVKKTLSNMKTIVSATYSDADSQIDVLLNDTKSVQKIASAMKLKGINGLVDTTLALAGGMQLKELQESLKSTYAGEFVQETAKELSKQLGDVSDILGKITDTVNLYNESAESVNLLMNMKYSYDVSMEILSALEASDDAVIKRVAKEQKEKLSKHNNSLYSEMLNNWMQDKENGLVSDGVSYIKKYIAKKTETKVLGWASALYSVFDAAGGWTKTYQTQEKSVIAGTMTNALKAAMNQAAEEGNSEAHLHMLRYVIEMRFIGERSFEELAKLAVEKQTNKTEEQIKQELDRVIVNYDNQVEKIAAMRDTIFRTAPKPLDVPEAPKASVNYSKLCTNESFDASYEYSFDNENWITCSGTPISFVPKSYTTSMYIRVKGSSESVAGSIKILSLPAIRKFDKYARVLWYNGVYRIEGLTPGETYTYAPTYGDMTSSESLIAWQKAVKASSEGTITFEGEKANYLMMKLPVTTVKPASAATALQVTEIKDVSIPTASPASGEVSKGTKIKLTSKTPNAIIYYTTDGTTPTRESAYWSPYTNILVNGPLTIKAMASIPDNELYYDSKVVTFTWTVKKEEPIVPPTTEENPKEEGTTQQPPTTEGTTQQPPSTEEAPQGKPETRITLKSSAKTTKTVSKKKITFSLKASAQNGQKLSYKSNNKSIKVDAKGKVTVKAKYIGGAVITITANETATHAKTIKKVTVQVNPPKAKLSLVKAGKKQASVKFAKATGGVKYQIQYSTNKSFKKATTKTITYSKKGVKISKLKSKKTYYFRIRYYKKTSGVTCYGAWSGAKKVKVK